MKKLILVKLGGSLITDKTKPFTARNKNIQRLVLQIKRALRQSPELQIIIGNGAGSFAHAAAKGYATTGITSSTHIRAFSRIHAAAAQLNRIVVQTFIEEGINAVSFAPSSLIRSANRKIIRFETANIIGTLRLHMIPVLYGDIVYDKIKGSVIYSTEAVLNRLAIELARNNEPVHQVIYCTVTQGVLDEKGQTVSSITSGALPSLKQLFYKTEGYDVTGGMKQKVEECLKLAERGITSLIINGVENHNLQKALLGKPVIGTLIR